jgi:hypothetical protein
MSKRLKRFSTKKDWIAATGQLVGNRVHMVLTTKEVYFIELLVLDDTQGVGKNMRGKTMQFPSESIEEIIIEY